MTNTTTMTMTMTSEEKGERIKAIGDQWYATFRKYGEKEADRELTASMRAYFAEMDARAR